MSAASGRSGSGAAVASLGRQVQGLLALGFRAYPLRAVPEEFRFHSYRVYLAT